MIPVYLQVLDLATRKLTEKERKFIALEKAINPLLDDDDMVGLSHILTNIVQACKNLPKSGAFHEKVDAKKVISYLCASKLYYNKPRRL